MSFEITEQDVDRVIDYYGITKSFHLISIEDRSTSKQIGLSTDLETVEILAP